jgi:hypothetical protein
MPEDWGAEPLEEDVVFDHVTWDAFGVPSNIMGRHDEDFFSILGRIVALAATLEYKILVFREYLVGRRQDVFTKLTVAKLIASKTALRSRRFEVVDSINRRLSQGEIIRIRGSRCERLERHARPSAASWKSNASRFSAKRLSWVHLGMTERSSRATTSLFSSPEPRSGVTPRRLRLGREPPARRAPVIAG